MKEIDAARVLSRAATTAECNEKRQTAAADLDRECRGPVQTAAADERNMIQNNTSAAHVKRAWPATPLSAAPPPARASAAGSGRRAAVRVVTTPAVVVEQPAGPAGVVA